jgi:hypothetical protein
MLIAAAKSKRHCAKLSAIDFYALLHNEHDFAHRVPMFDSF